jgi:putative ABC transport system permease protein
MFRLTIKELLAKKLRLLTTALAVMLGVAFMAGTLVLTDTMNSTFDSLLTDAYSGTDAFVRGESGLENSTAPAPRIDETVVDQIAQLDGVEASFGFITGYAQIVDHDGKAMGNPGMGAPVFGETWITDDELNPYNLTEGHAPSANGEVVIDQNSADKGDFAIGEQISVLTKEGSDTFTISGFAGFGSEDSAGGASAVLFTEDDAHTYVSSPGMIDSVLVRGAPDVTQASLSAEIATILPNGNEVLTGDEITKETQDDVKAGMAFFSTFLLVFAGIALFVGAFIIFNTFSIIVTQRQKEMALLRAIGASTRQVMRSVMLEAAVVGTLASLSGLTAGIGVAAGLKQLLAGFGMELPEGGLAITSSTVITSMIVGVTVTLLSAWFPARKAGKIPPVAAMRAVALDRTGTSRKRAVIGTTITALGVAAMFNGQSTNALGMIGIGALVTFIGVVVIAPVVARPASKVLGWPMHRGTTMSGTLARENAIRNPKRTASTAAALMIGVALVGFIATLAASTKQSISGSLDKNYRGDFVVDSGTFGQGGLSHSLRDEIAGRPEFTSVTSDRMFEADLNGSTVFMNSWDAATVESLFDFDWQQGDPASLGTDGIALYDGYAEDHSLAIGSTMPVTFSQGSATLTVRAIYGDKAWTGDAFIDHSVLDALGADPLDSAIFVQVADGLDQTAAQGILDQMTADYPTADVLDLEGFKKAEGSDVDMILNLIYALLFLAIIIALMGITNTLALSIFERTRELGVLRAVGMTKSQMKATVRWEAMIIALFGTLLGLGIGLFFGWSIVSALGDQGIDTLVIPVPTLVIVTTIAALAGVVASVMPARRAAKLDILGAIAAQ